LVGVAGGGTATSVRFPREVNDREVEQAERLWRETSSSWARYLNENAAMPLARRFLARAQEKQADVLAVRAAYSQPDRRPAFEQAARVTRLQAAANWNDVAEQTPDLQTLAYRYHAQRLKRLAGKK